MKRLYGGLLGRTLRLADRAVEPLHRKHVEWSFKPGPMPESAMTSAKSATLVVVVQLQASINSSHSLIRITTGEHQMEILQRAVVLSAAALLTAAPAVNAQVTEEGMGKMVPVELFACTFNDGQNMGDFDKVVARWNELMDENDVDTYAAWTLTPVFYGPEQNFDFIWMGAWSDGNAMGTGSDMWLSEGGDIAAGFNRVADCDAHILLSSAQYKAPAGGETPGSSILRMTNCEMKVGVRYSDVMSAEIEWADYMNENGSEAGTWHWFPQLGGGDSGFDYKIVNAYPNFAALGKDWEHSANGGGREESQDLFGDLDDCDDARVYVGKSRREAQLR